LAFVVFQIVVQTSRAATTVRHPEAATVGTMHQQNQNGSPRVQLVSLIPLSCMVLKAHTANAYECKIPAATVLLTAMVSLKNRKRKWD